MWSRLNIIEGLYRPPPPPPSIPASLHSFSSPSSSFLDLYFSPLPHSRSPAFAFPLFISSSNLHIAPFSICHSSFLSLQSSTRLSLFFLSSPILSLHFESFPSLLSSPLFPFSPLLYLPFLRELLTHLAGVQRQTFRSSTK